MRHYRLFQGNSNLYLKVFLRRNTSNNGSKVRLRGNLTLDNIQNNPLFRHSLPGGV